MNLVEAFATDLTDRIVREARSQLGIDVERLRLMKASMPTATSDDEPKRLIELLNDDKVREKFYDLVDDCHEQLTDRVVESYDFDRAVESKIENLDIEDFLDDSSALRRAVKGVLNDATVSIDV